MTLCNKNIENVTKISQNHIKVQIINEMFEVKIKNKKRKLSEAAHVTVVDVVPLRCKSDENNT